MDDVLISPKSDARFTEKIDFDFEGFYGSIETLMHDQIFFNFRTFYAI